jgi:hypothetical protein
METAIWESIVTSGAPSFVLVAVMVWRYTAHTIPRLAGTFEKALRETRAEFTKALEEQRSDFREMLRAEREQSARLVSRIPKAN